LTKAVILAGGHGTRLRPLTNIMPKPLVPLAGKTLIDRLISTLPETVDGIIVAAGYMGKEMEEHFRNFHCQVEVVTEHEPLGTAGALFQLRQRLNDTFIVLNGDVISSLNIKEMIEFHRKKKAVATISVWTVQDASSFGALRLDGDGRINEFREKPRFPEPGPSPINAGTYVMESEIFDYMDISNLSLEREIFPKLVNGRMYGYSFEGYWIDCGTRENYLKAQSLLLEMEGHTVHSASRLNGCVINRPLGIEQGARLEGARIGPNVYIERGVTIGEGSTVEESTVLAGARIGRHCTIRRSIICPGAVVEDNTEQEDIILGAAIH
jgi:mannose-1-phosphate guanylyltransferase